MVDVIARNAVTQTGKGPTIVMAHGFGCDQTMWRAFAARLDGFTRVAYDLTGMGESDYSAYNEARHRSLDGHADDLIDVLDSLADGPFLVVGHSVSAMIAGIAAIKRPELFEGIAMIGPNPCYINDPPYEGGFEQSDIDGLLDAVEQNYTGWAGQLAGLVGGPASPEAVGILEARFCKNDPIISRHFARTTFLADNREDVPKIPCPCLVIQSSEDAIAPLGVGDYMVEHLQDGRLAIVACRGHAPHMTQPEPTAAAVKRFASQIR
jgi:sigma-B regulation protein RsbQ